MQLLHIILCCIYRVLVMVVFSLNKNSPGRDIPYKAKQKILRNLFLFKQPWSLSTEHLFHDIFAQSQRT